MPVVITEVAKKKASRGMKGAARARAQTRTLQGRCRKRGVHLNRYFDEEELDLIAKTGAQKEGGGTPEALEFRRHILLRLLLRGVSHAQIQEYLGISKSTLYHDIRHINDQMTGEVTDFNYPLFIGKTLAFYDEARNIALRVAADERMMMTNPRAKHKKPQPLRSLVGMATRMTALNAAINAENSKHTFLRLAGLYTTAEAETGNPFDSQNSDKGTDADSLREALMAVLEEGKGKKELVVVEDADVIEMETD